MIYTKTDGKYYKDNPEVMKSRNEKRMWVNGKYIAHGHPLHKAGRYKNFEDAAFSSLEKYNSSKEGQVYIIVNESFPQWIKVLGSQLVDGSVSLDIEVSNEISEAVVITEGTGLERMKMRARSLGGWADYASADGRFIVLASVPLALPKQK